jgi:2-haloacid dehalogenase
VSDLGQIEALTFDVFGTVVDWRTSVSRQLTAVGARVGVELDWDAFADRWRGGYHSGMARVNAGEDDWKLVDAIHRERLDLLLDEYGMSERLSEPEKQDLSRAWHRLDPWPEAVEGVTRMKSKFVVAALSNGNVSLLANMAKHGRLPWDCVLSAELAGCYKPDHRVYQRAAELLDLPCCKMLMVAAHSSDLRGAKGAGLQTALVARPDEFGPGRGRDLDPNPEFDLFARDFNHLSEILGC